MLSEYLMRFIGIRYRDCQIVTETRFYVKGDRKPPWHYCRSAWQSVARGSCHIVRMTYRKRDGRSGSN